MATVKAEGKSAFLKEFFVDYPDAGEPAIDEAWRAAGHEDSISSSLISKVRSDLGLTAKRRSKSKRAQAVGARKLSSGDPNSNGRRTGPEVRGRTAARANARTATVSSERPAKMLAAGKDRTECSSFWRARSTTCSTRSGWREDFPNSRRLCGRRDGSWSATTRNEREPSEGSTSAIKGWRQNCAPARSPTTPPPRGELWLFIYAFVSGRMSADSTKTCSIIVASEGFPRARCDPSPARG